MVFQVLGAHSNKFYAQEIFEVRGSNAKLLPYAKKTVQNPYGKLVKIYNFPSVILVIRQVVQNPYGKFVIVNQIISEFQIKISPINTVRF